MADERKATNTKTDDTKKILEKMDSLDKKMKEINENTNFIT